MELELILNLKSVFPLLRQANAVAGTITLPNPCNAPFIVCVSKTKIIVDIYNYKFALDDNIQKSNKIDLKKLKYFNGYGGFDLNEKEYTFLINKNNNLPTVWSNILANENFGCITTNSGIGCTWSKNSRLNKLSAWNNNQVTNLISEGIFIQDEDSLKVTKMNNGMVIIITPDKEIREVAYSGDSHRRIAQEIFDGMDVEHIDFKGSDGDFGQIIPDKYNCIFIRVVSILNGATGVYVPKVCTDYQLEQLKKFNEEVKSFNEGHPKEYRVEFDYLDKPIYEESHDLDRLIKILEERSKANKK